MIRLDFNTYQNRYNFEKPLRNPTQYIYEDDNIFVLMFKSKEKWMHYTVVDKFDIIKFGLLLESDEEKSINDFKINYCSNSVYAEHFVFYNNQNNPKTLFNSKSFASQLKTKSRDVDAGDDFIIEASDYSDFLLKTFDRFEKRVLNSINERNMQKQHLNKTFGDFMQNLFNIINTFSFASQVKRYLKIDLVTGLEEAEKELNIDIGFSEEYQDKLNILQAQQVDGYIINGKKWPGIKGVTKEIQANVIQTVQNGINDNKGIDEIKTDVKKTFDGFSEWRSEMIARTETTRIINDGKVLGYKQSEMDGEKVWSTAPFEAGRSSEICQRLKNQSVELDDDFSDPETNKRFAHPPAHPNCRSTIYFKPK